MAGALAQILLRAKLAKQGTAQTTTVASAPSPTSQPRINVGSILAGHRIMTIPSDSPEMLNANRPVDDIPPAPTLSAPAPSVPALQSIAQTNSPAITSFDWKKYLPWILIVLAVIVVIMSSRKRSA